MRQDRICIIILDYNENSAAQYMYKQAVIHITLSNSLYQIQYIASHDTARQYRTCIMDSDMASVLIQSLCIKHLVHNNVYCTSWSCLMYILFMQSLYPSFNFHFFSLLVPLLFLLLLTIAIIHMNVQIGISLFVQTSMLVSWKKRLNSPP